jgi:hypothetical protein
MLRVGAKPLKNGFTHQNKAKSTPNDASWCGGGLSAVRRIRDLTTKAEGQTPMGGDLARLDSAQTCGLESKKRP